MPRFPLLIAGVLVVAGGGILLWLAVGCTSPPDQRLT